MSSYVKKLGFPVFATTRFYFQLNYSGRHLRLDFKPGKAFALVMELIFNLVV